MTQGVYINAITPNAGKSLITLGLIDILHTHTNTIGLFKPITETTKQQDPLIQLIQNQFKINPNNIQTALTQKQAHALLAAGKGDEIYQKCVTIYNQMAKQCELIIVEGTDLTGYDPATEINLNTKLASHLSIPVIPVITAKNRTPAEITETINLTTKKLTNTHCKILAIIINRTNPQNLQNITNTLQKNTQHPTYCLPEITNINRPTIQQVTQQLQATHIGGTHNTNRDINEIRIAAMNVNNFLHLLNDGNFVITPGDRSDIILTTLASALSTEFPVPSGLLLTGGIQPDPTIKKILDNAPFPIYSIKTDTYTAAKQISEIKGNLTSANPQKIATALGTWSKHINKTEILNKISLPQTNTTTPLRFTHTLIERARNNKQHIVLPEGNDPRILRAAEILNKREVCQLTILGNPQTIKKLAANEAIDLTGIHLTDPTTSPLKTQFAKEYTKLRAHKGITLEYAEQTMNDPSYFGTMMVHLGLTNGMVSGAAHTTANTIRPALEFIKTKPGVKIVSSVFFMCLPDRVLVYGDCAVNPNPTATQLADIAIASANTAKNFNIKPKIAMLSYSTGESGSGEAVDKVRQATQEVKNRHPNLAIEGPIQYDAATDTTIAATKLPNSTVAGHATIFIFPDLNTGNNTYKAVQQSSKTIAIGPILQGLNKPVNDLSRGCTIEDIVNTIAITAIQAQNN